MRNTESDYPGIYFLSQKEIKILNGKNDTEKESLYLRSVKLARAEKENKKQ